MYREENEVDFLTEIAPNTDRTGFKNAKIFDSPDPVGATLPTACSTEANMTSQQATEPNPLTLDSVVIRFCGDSGDGMQLTGGQFADTSAIFGNDFAYINTASVLVKCELSAQARSATHAREQTQASRCNAF